tara:strand:+ start:11 stop:1084 length:1074 start_codon:yes stop_codon:yes gene_type:complete
MSKFFNRIVNGDCLKEIKKIPNKSFDLVFADPPYNMQIGERLTRPDESKVNGVNDKWDQFNSFKHYDKFSLAWLSECRRILKDNGSIWVIGSYHNIFRLGYHMQNLDYWLLNDVIWRKNNPMPNFRGTRFTNAHETLIWASKNKKSKYTFNYQSLKCLNDDLQMRSDWTLPICNGKERLKKNGKKIHSTQKPEALMHRIILATTKKGDKIFDPFLGTGTTAVVAKKLGRKYFGIEKDKKYFEATIERIKRTKAIEENYLDTIENNKSKQRVPFGSLVELGILKPGTTLFDLKKKINAKIMADGSIKYKDSEGSIHKVAAKIMGAENYNGWTYWHCNINGSIVAIDSLRQKFISGTKA